MKKRKGKRRMTKTPKPPRDHEKQLRIRMKTLDEVAAVNELADWIAAACPKATRPARNKALRLFLLHQIRNRDAIDRDAIVEGDPDEE
jgi:hypothetical protein